MSKSRYLKQIRRGPLYKERAAPVFRSRHFLNSTSLCGVSDGEAVCIIYKSMV